MKHALHVLVALFFLVAGCGEQSQPVVKPRPPGPIETDQGASEQATEFLYVKIPEAIMPIDRGAKYEDPINDALSSAGLGEVTGGGSMLNEDRSIDFVGVDIDVVDVDRALPIIVETLRKAGAPKGTTIEQYEPKRVDHPVWQCARNTQIGIGSSLAAAP